MKQRTISAYISQQGYIIAICSGEAYRFTDKLNQETNDKLLKAVQEAGRIETDRWVKIQQQ